MDQDDPEKRIADLERQQGAGPAQTQQVGPQPTANTESKTERGRRSFGIGRWLTAIIFVGVGLYFASFSAQQLYGYAVGAPTTATDIHCRYGVPGSGPPDRGSAADLTLSGGCTATWSLDGQSQTGPIVGVNHLGSADVHVKGGTAFTAPFSSWFFGGHLLALLFVVFGVGQFWDIGRLWSWMKPGRR
jgi:hypothetical protein